MEYQILIVEDDDKIHKMLQEEFGSDYEPFRARSVDEAIGIYEFRKETKFPFDCFIIDLEIIASGLTEQEMVDFEKREGYALLKNIWGMWPEDEEYVRKRTIICSRYASEFEEEYSENDLAYLILISKKKKGFEKLVKKAVNKITRNNE